MPEDPEDPADRFEPAAGQIVTVFRSRLDPAARAAYAPVAAELDALARTMPGCLDVKGFTAPDGERVTIVTFADRATHDAWRHHARHREAQAAGRATFYERYAIQVAVVERASSFTRPQPSTADDGSAPVDRPAPA